MIKEDLDILKTRYEVTIKSEYDSLFYDNVYEYIDWIIKNPQLNSILEKMGDEYRNKHIEIWEGKTNTPEDSAERTRQTYKLERFNAYCAYISLQVRIYLAIEEYKKTDEPDYLQDPVVVMMLNNGYKNLPIKKYAKMATEKGKPYLWTKDNIQTYKSWYQNGRKDYEIELRQFHSGFLTEVVKSKESNALEINTKLPAFRFNPRTGDFRYYLTEGTIALGTIEFRMFSLLYSRIGIFVDHLTLSRVMNSSITTVSKSHKDSLSQVIRNLKEKFGILPKTSSSNPDIFKNNPKAGYRLIFNDTNAKNRINP